MAGVESMRRADRPNVLIAEQLALFHILHHEQRAAKYAAARFLNLLERSHSCGNDQRFSGTSYFFNQRDVYQFKRRNLVRRDVHFFQKVDCCWIEWCRKQIQPKVISHLLQFRLPLPGRVRLSVEFVQRPTVPDSASIDAEIPALLCRSMQSLRSWRPTSW